MNYDDFDYYIYELARDGKLDEIKKNFSAYPYHVEAMFDPGSVYQELAIRAACASGHRDVISYLLDNHIKYDRQTLRNCILKACDHNQLDVIELLSSYDNVGHVLDKDFSKDCALRASTYASKEVIDFFFSKIDSDAKNDVFIDLCYQNHNISVLYAGDVSLQTLYQGVAIALGYESFDTFYHLFFSDGFDKKEFNIYMDNILKDESPDKVKMRKILASINLQEKLEGELAPAQQQPRNKI